MQEIIRQIKTQFGERPLDNPNYGKIINEKHFNRLLSLMDGTKTVFGGQIDRAALRISPTVLDPVSWADPVMQEEIFGPILPVLTIKSLEDVPEILRTSLLPWPYTCSPPAGVPSNGSPAGVNSAAGA